MRFVEIVDVEDQVSFRSRETAEIHQMAIAADREFNPGMRHPPKIEGLQIGAAVGVHDRLNAGST